MKIVLTHLDFYNEKQSLSSFMRPMLPMRLQFISSYLKKIGMENELYDSTFQSLSKLKSFVKKNKPKYVCVYINPYSLKDFVDFVKYIKANKKLKEINVFPFGPGIEGHTEQLLHAGADAIIVGEEEDAMLELINSLEIPFNPFIDHVNGIIYANALGETVSTGTRELHADIGAYAYPSWEGIDVSEYISVRQKYFCSDALPISIRRGEGVKDIRQYEYKGRRKTPAVLIDEMKQLDFHQGRFLFRDEDFLDDIVWVRLFADLMFEESFEFEVVARPGTLDETMLIELRKAGLRRVYYESRSMYKNITSKEQRDKFLEKIVEVEGVELAIYLEVGYKGDVPVQELIDSLPTKIIAINGQESQASTVEKVVLGTKNLTFGQKLKRTFTGKI